VLVQNALQRYNQMANNTNANWVRAMSDLQGAFGVTQTNLLQAIVYPRDNTGPGGTYGLLNATLLLDEPIYLPWTYDNGSSVALGDPGLGYPAMLYPNLTQSGPAFDNSTFVPINATDDPPTYPPPAPFNSTAFLKYGMLLLGPWSVNESFALLSLSLPIINNTSKTDILGYMTVVANAQGILNVLNSAEGLDTTGEALLLGPDTFDSRFLSGSRNRGLDGFVVNTTDPVSELPVKFVFPPENNETIGARHKQYAYGQPQTAFPMKTYPAVLEAYEVVQGDLNNAGSLISTKNEQGIDVSVGFAVPSTSLCDWVLIVEESKAEAFAPIVHLRNILLACVFGTVGFICIAVFPIAHYSVRPISRLKDATKESTSSIMYEDDDYEGGSSSSQDLEGNYNEKAGSRLAFWRKRKPKKIIEEDSRRRQFKIPAKVKDNKHFIQDELTDLTSTYNQMTEELLKQYETLEDRVSERTAQLEQSKKAAEAANESKTMFIASISHELKTPLNGILGMCAVCMTENDVPRIRQSLKMVNESGELLLSLLNDLLTFSKHQIGHRITLEEREFRLALISRQILSIFDKQAKDAGIVLTADFEGGVPDPNAAGMSADRLSNMGPVTGKVENFNVWGDRNRILQVLINLVNNSLKFTPSGGSVKLKIKCMEEVSDVMDHDDSSRRGSHRSKPSKQGSRNDSAQGSIRSDHRYLKKMDTALTINALDDSSQPIVIMSDKSVPPPSYARAFAFVFEVQDTGPGIPEDLQDRVFEPFVQGDIGLSKKFGGTGLGLSICSQLAKVMGGDISLQSTVGVGSTFTMRIPLKLIKEQAESTIDSRRESFNDDQMGRSDSVSNGSIRSVTSHGNAVSFEKPANTRLVGLRNPFFANESGPAPAETSLQTLSPRDDGRIRILVADDNTINQEVVLRMLKLEDIYDITVAKDGQEALEKVKESMEQGRRFNLIFMDIQMPNLDGLQSTRQIRDLGYSAPIVALTAFAEESNVKECMDSGMNYFLAKPIRRPALKHVLKTYCAPIPEEAEGGQAIDEATASPSNSEETQSSKAGPVVVVQEQTAGSDASKP
jgi:osomolarity two-component system sensor histidine kinase SLN1